MTNREYLDDLVISLRLRGVPGAEIGAFVEEARHHLESSGESAEEAFGTVEDYATDLAVSIGRRATPQGWSRREFVWAAFHFLAWFLFARGAISWAMGESVEITIGMIVGFGLGLLLAAKVVWPAFVAYATRRMGLPLAGASVAGSVLVVALALGLGGQFLWSDGVLVTIPAPSLVAASVALLIVSFILLARRSDPIQYPG